MSPRDIELIIIGHVHVYSTVITGARCAALNTTFAMATVPARHAREMSIADTIDKLITSSEINVSALRTLTTALSDQVANSEAPLTCL